jgi:D-arginine dehydrogenase
MLGPMERHTFDAVVIGAGIAGASLAAALASTHRVVLLEAEEVAGYHSTGRSAAIWIQNYGPEDVRHLSRLSRPFFELPPPGFADYPLIRRRPVIFLAPPDQRSRLESMLAEGLGLRPLSPAEAQQRVPALRSDYAVAAAIEEDAFDIDVAALHQGYLRQLCAAGGVLALRSRAEQIERHGSRWAVQTSGGTSFEAPVLVNAAGAWADGVARLAHIASLGLTPCRRTAVIIHPAPWKVADWPLLNDAITSWYARPEARTRLMVSPADETPMSPHDVQPDELDIAVAIDRMQQALTIDVQRIERAWAGLRTFTRDGSLAIGWDPIAPGFFWCAGQGGYGIQTSPAAGQLAASVIRGGDPGEATPILPRLDPRRFQPTPAHPA